MKRGKGQLKLLLGGKEPVPSHLRRPEFPVSTSEIEHLKCRLEALQTEAFMALHGRDFTLLAALANELDQTDVSLKACKALAGIDG